MALSIQMIRNPIAAGFLTLALLAVTLSVLPHFAAAENCGRQAGNAVCPGGLCCSQFGWCGNTREHCENNCQSQCTAPSTGGGDVGSIITPALFEELLKHRNDGACEGRGFYTYNAFISAARSFPGFGTTGDATTRRKELAAFLAQTSHETTGYCFIRERQRLQYCSSNQWPCPAGRQYYGRGPIQLTHNYNYGQAGRAIGQDLINNPDLVATNADISFRTAMWFWMTDSAANRVSGYGVITNIINGGLECGHGADDRVANRIGFYQRYCSILGVSPGGNLDCANQRPFNQ
ncbi:unnamed protein product [Linum tenue]|uniref:Chitin-binding type-1 domain-containing protein n=1 Tax=Linum tenue TaxID=586396 RepID=A0AAV0NII8_9ROSI|nr:unnamed protein product [Linum tenue]